MKVTASLIFLHFRSFHCHRESFSAGSNGETLTEDTTGEPK